MDEFVGIFLVSSGMMGVWVLMFAVEEVEVDNLGSMILLLILGVVLLLGSVIGFGRLIYLLPKNPECIQVEIAPGFKIKGELSRTSGKIE